MKNIICWLKGHRLYLCNQHGFKCRRCGYFYGRYRYIADINAGAL